MASITTVSDKTDNLEVDLIWHQVQDRVVKLAGGDATKVQRHLDIDDVLAFIDHAQTVQKDKSEKYKWFKATVNRTLQCIQTVGGIVASASSQVR